MPVSILEAKEEALAAFAALSLLLIVLVGLLLANGLSLTLVMAERMSSVRNVMLEISRTMFPPAWRFWIACLPVNGRSSLRALTGITITMYSPGSQALRPRMPAPGMR
jgi:hypothetical protein